MLHKGTWNAIKSKLKKDRDDYVDELLRDLDIDKTNEVRGRIRMIDDILERYPHEIFDEEDES